MKYIDILLLSNGIFCMAPAWSIREGDLVGLPDFVSGCNKVLEVVSVVTDKEDGKFTKMVKRYVGGELPKVTQRYKQSDVLWEDEEDGLE